MLLVDAVATWMLRNLMKLRGLALMTCIICNFQTLVYVPRIDHGAYESDFKYRFTESYDHQSVGEDQP